MAFDAGTIVGTLQLGIAEFKKGLTDAQKASKSAFDGMKNGVINMNKSIEGITPTLQKAAFGLTAISAGATLMIKDWLGEATEAEKISKQLDAVLLSTKNAAGLTADEIKNMAGQLQSVTTIGDDAIVAGQNMLLTFTQIGKDVFPQATETLLDMTTAMNSGATPTAEQLAQQAIQLGKALNDPTVGMAALSRVGVKFTEEQKEQITTLQASGDIMGAQKIILNELAVEFGGSASAQAETFAGKAQQLTNTWGDFKEELGFALMPILAQFAEMLKQLIDWFKNLSPEVKEIIAKVVLFTAVIAGLGAPLLLLVTLIPTITTALGIMGGAIAFLFSPIGLLVAAAAGLFLAWQNNWFGIRDITVNAINVILKYYYILKQAAIDVFSAANEFIKLALETLGTIVLNGMSAISETWNALWGAIKETALAIIQPIMDALNGLLTMIENAINKLKELASKAGKSISNASESVGGTVLKGLNWAGIKMAEGGIVTKPTIAMIGEGGESEAVIPLSKLGNVGGGSGNVFNFYGAVTNEDAAIEMFEMAFAKMKPNLGV